MKFKEYKYLIFSDLYRVTGKISIKILFEELFLGESFKYIFWLKTCNFFKKNNLLKYILFPISRLMFNRYMYKFGIGIPYKTNYDLFLKKENNE